MKQYVIAANDAGQRLDKFLKKLLPNASASLIYKLNRKNKIKVNGKREDNEYKLQEHDEVKIFLIETEFQTLSQKQEVSVLPATQKFNIKNIVYEDADVLVINKDPGVNVHPGDHKTKELDVITQVRDYLGNKLNSLTFSPSLVHRIDRDTSGVLIIGKKKDMLTKLVNDFKSHEKVKKVYYAMVLGKLPQKKGVIDKKLLRIEDAKGEDKVQVSEKGQVAISHYTALSEHTILTPQGPQTITEVEVEIKTGRMHQIRVHLASLGTPILGDNKYGEKSWNAYFSKHFGLQRQALHAWKIEFFHYGKGKKQFLQAHLKDDMKKFLEKISQK